MTPVASWSPHDYYLASRRARRLGEDRLAQQQIQGVLDQADAGAVGLIEPVCSDIPPSLDGLALTANGSRREPHHRARTGAEEGA